MINNYYNQSREIVNRYLQKIEEDLEFHDLRQFGQFCATSPRSADGRPAADAQPLARGGGIRLAPAVFAPAPPTTNRGVESSQYKKAEWEVRRAAVSSDGIKYYGGVDGSSEVLLYGNSLPASLMATLDQYREQAIQERKPVAVVLAGNSGRLSAAPRGSVGYSWSFEVGGLSLFLHRSPSESIPVCKLVLGFHAVDQVHPAGLVRWAKDFLFSLGVKVQREHIRRLDIQITAACDMSEYAAAACGQKYLTFQQRKRVDEVGGRVETVTFGSHDSPISFKIYDKFGELLAGGECPKLEAITSRFSDSPDSDYFGPLTRFEFSLTRDMLRKFEINNFEDYEQKKLALVEYLTFNWFRITDTVPDRENKHQSRAKTSGIWERVQEMFRSVFLSPVATFARPKKERSALLTDQKKNGFWLSMVGYLSRILADDVIKEGPAPGELSISSTVGRFAENYRAMIPPRFFQRLFDKALTEVQNYLEAKRARAIPAELL